MRRTLCIAALVACGGPARPAVFDVDPARRAALDTFMKKDVDPPFDELSYQLFHDSQARELPGTAQALAEVSARLREWRDPPVGSPQARQIFSDYTGELSRASEQLRAAVAHDDLSAAQRLFDDVRRRCDACHALFR